MQEPDYNQDSKLIFATLDGHEKSIDELYTSRNDHAEQIAVLKVKAGIWGLVGGAIPVGIGLAIWAIQKLLGG